MRIFALAVPILLASTFELIRVVESTRPNVVFVLTDDQDAKLNSLDYMLSVQGYPIDKGIQFRSPEANNRAFATWVAGVFSTSTPNFTEYADCETQSLADLEGRCTLVNISEDSLAMMTVSSWSQATLQKKLLQVKDKRASSPPLQTGIAPYTTASLFKVLSIAGKPLAKRWDTHFSKLASAQSTSVLKAGAIAKDSRELITLGTGRPNAEFYPWTSLSMTIDSGKSICISGEAAYDFSVALNYGYSAGSPQLLRFITEHVEIVHEPPYADWDCAITSGTTSALDLVLQILCNPGDSVLVEEYTYPGMLDALRSQGLSRVGVTMDERGLVPANLDSMLSNWNGAQSQKPHVLYTIPTGQNPTGITQPLERRKAIYAVAEKHDLLIIEDDPYIFLQLGLQKSDIDDHRSKSTAEDIYLRHLPASYLSLDTSGRVVRLDSTSKILAPGLRCGWITACSQTIAKFLARTDVTAVSANGVSQVMLYKLLEETWGHLGLVRWLMDLSRRYTRRLAIFADACEQYLPRGVCSWTLPNEGMFLWVTLNSSAHMLDKEEDIHNRAKVNGVLVSRGSWFRGNSKYICRDLKFRLTFAAASEGDLELAVDRFAEAVRMAMELDTSL